MIGLSTNQLVFPLKAIEAILLIHLFGPSPVFGQNTIFKGFEVRTLKREMKHFETAALICALHLEGEDEDLIAEAWTMNFPEGASWDDQLLVSMTTRTLCSFP